MLHAVDAADHALFLRLNAPAGTPSWLVSLADVVANDVIYLLPLLLLGLWLRGGGARRGLALRALLVALLALGIGQTIGALWPRPRPFVLGLGHAWMAHAPDPSFPSDHVTVFCGIGLTLLLGGAVGWGGAVLLAGLGVAWARVFLGVHFPLDIAGGAVVAAAAWAVAAPLWRIAGDACTRLAQQLYRAIFAWPIAAGWLRR